MDSPTAVGPRPFLSFSSTDSFTSDASGVPRTRPKRARVAKHRRPARPKPPLAMHFNFAVDRLEVTAREVVHTPKAAASVPRAGEGPRTWRQRLGDCAQALWPVAGAVGSAVVFLLSRVGVGLRGEDLAWLLRLGPISPE